MTITYTTCKFFCYAERVVFIDSDFTIEGNVIGQSVFLNFVTETEVNYVNLCVLNIIM